MVLPYLESQLTSHSPTESCGKTSLTCRLPIRPLALEHPLSILQLNSDAMNPEARCRAARQCLEGSESRDRLSELVAWPVSFCVCELVMRLVPVHDNASRRRARWPTTMVPAGSS